jgi:ubiquinone biosynthesis protein
MNIPKQRLPIKQASNSKKISTLRVWKFAGEFQIRYGIQKDKKKFGKWLRNELISLGPAFVKIGQFLSTRIDLFNKDTITYLKDLQDNIEPVPFSEIETVLNKEYGDYFNIFNSFDPEPIASASIGQVHKATLKNNQEVVVKIQKLDIEELISNDLTALSNVNNFFVKIGLQQARDFEAVIDQYKVFLANEVNYRKEANYMLYFRKKIKKL